MSDQPKPTGLEFEDFETLAEEIQRRSLGFVLVVIPKAQVDKGNDPYVHFAQFGAMHGQWHLLKEAAQKTLSDIEDFGRTVDG